MSPKTEAGQQIETFYAIRKRDGDSTTPVTNCATTNFIAKTGTFLKAGYPERPRFCYHAKEDDVAAEEVVWAIHGVIANRDGLAPFVDKNKMRKNPLQMENTIILTGLDAPSFQNALDGVRAMFDYAKEYETNWEGSLEDLLFDNYAGYNAVSIRNPWFCPKPSKYDIGHVRFSNGEDPQGLLASLMSKNERLRHIDENEVHYQRHDGRNANGKCVSPAYFQTGQTVEVLFTFSIIPAGGGRFRLGLILRQINIWDGRVFSIPRNIALDSTGTNTKGRLKRKVGQHYANEEDNLTSRKLAALALEKETTSTPNSDLPQSSDDSNIPVNTDNTNESSNTDNSYNTNESNTSRHSSMSIED